MSQQGNKQTHAKQNKKYNIRLFLATRNAFINAHKAKIKKKNNNQMPKKSFQSMYFIRLIWTFPLQYDEYHYRLDECDCF